MSLAGRTAAIVAVVVLAAWPAQAQPIAAKDLAFKSTGGPYGSGGWYIYSVGYAGTFIHLDNPAAVTFDVQAAGEQALGIWPIMNLRVDDQVQTWSISTPTMQTYSTTLNLPAGTHLVRTEFTNDYYAGGYDRNLIVNSLSVAGSGVSVLNSATRENSLAAADTYIENVRKGAANVTLTLPGGGHVAEGTPVHVQLKRHAFNFGTAVPGVEAADTNWWLNGSTANGQQFQQKLNSHFNMISTETAGKWLYNEATRNVPTMGTVDAILDYAEAHNLRARMHNVVWDSDSQNPDWVNTLKGQAQTDPAAEADLRSAISSRIQYYVRDRANRYVEVDGINESYHHQAWGGAPSDARAASVYNEIADAATAAGAPTRVMFNEYSVLNNDSGTPYGGAYLEHVRAVLRGGVTDATLGRLGLGVQDYIDGTSSNDYEAVRTYRSLANLGALHMPITLTEFGIADGIGTPEWRAQVLAETMRLVFGSADTNGLVLWGFWHPLMWKSGSALFDDNWNITPAGKAWEQLLGIHDWGLADVPTWTTDLTATVDSEGRIVFKGFYGDYEVTLDGKTYDLTLDPGTTDYTMAVPEPGTMALVSAAVGWAALAARRRSARMPTCRG